MTTGRGLLAYWASADAVQISPRFNRRSDPTLRQPNSGLLRRADCGWPEGIAALLPWQIRPFVYREPTTVSDACPLPSCACDRPGPCHAMTLARPVAPSVVVGKRS